jgi:beta-mannosidase
MPRRFQPLVGPWKFLHDGAWYSAQVPGCVHMDLFRNGLIPDPFWGANEGPLQWIEEKDWIYRIEFDLQNPDYQHVELVAEGLDTVTEIRLNNGLVARTDNMFTGYRYDIQSRLQEFGNILELEFASPLRIIRRRQKPGDAEEWNDPVGGSSRLRKEPCSFGWDWGPRFATSGIYMPIGLEAWNHNRIETIRIRQVHGHGDVELQLQPEFATDYPVEYRGSLSFNGGLLEKFSGSSVRIQSPWLWWPNGHGDQPLYELRLEVLAENGLIVDRWEKRIGLRTIELDRHQDAFGESFQFKINNRPIFAKGANWIPAHSFVTEASPEMYKDLINSAAAVGMNMLRVWGGGIYEKDLFYDLCDEKGLLVWQDFMFACALYPGEEAFLQSVEREAAFQIQRLAHHASLALWCGNNELEQKPDEIQKTEERQRAYEVLFYDLLPETVATCDGTTAYWPSSPHNPAGYAQGPNSEKGGDSHLWDVWHLRKPVKHYEKQVTRFCSEFGMQSYSSPQVAATFCAPDRFNIQGPEMENHQKNAAGNEIIFDYVSKRYRFPKDYAALAYLSQLNQAYCIKVGIEHFRRSMPQTMGALYWQLNDCWPVASWSSIEFGGRWKALHYEVKRAFARALVSVHIPGDEVAGKGNQVRSTINELHIYTVFDGLTDRAATLRWRLLHIEGEPLQKDQKNVSLHHGESIRQLSIDFQTQIVRYGAANLLLRVELVDETEVLSEQTVFFTAPKRLNLQEAPINVSFSPSGDFVDMILRSPVFHHGVMIDFEGIDCRPADNFIDLFPDEERRISLPTKASVKALQAAFSSRSLIDSF